MITRAAVRINIDDKEIIIPCHRHCDSFQIIKALRPEWRAQYHDADQGFLNEHEEFLSRKEAWDEAMRCHQIIHYTEFPGTLYSEDLW